MIDSLADTLRAENVSCGWFRGSGVLADVELRAFNVAEGALGPLRRIDGPIHALTLDGGIGWTQSGVSVSLRALLTRDTVSGVETHAGEITSARTVGVEMFITVLDDLAIERAVGGGAGVTLFGGMALGAPDAAARGAQAAQTSWTATVEASSESAARPRAGGVAPGSAASALATAPPRYVRPGPDLDSPVPEAGDMVDHFAFGLCDVVKSDGDRLHLRVGKEGRVREIALEMLRVSRLADAGGKPLYKLERRI